jgi:hypothetical protein
MTDRRRLSDDAADERIRAWLDDQPVMAPRTFVDATLAPIPAMAQRRRSLVAIGRMQVPVATLARFGAVAAVLVVLVIGALAAFRPATGPGGIPGASPSPSATTSGSVPLPSGIGYTNNGPLGVGSGAESARAGTYQSRLLQPAVRFTAPDGWSVVSLVNTFVGGSESATGLPLSNGLGGIVITVPTSVEPPAPGDPGAPVPADLFAWLLTNPNLDLGPAADVTIGGVPGRSVEGTLGATASIDPAEGAYRIVDYLPLLPRQRFRLAVIAVDGQQMIVASLANATDFDAFGPVADGIIATIEFPDR